MAAKHIMRLWITCLLFVFTTTIQALEIEEESQEYEEIECETVQETDLLRNGLGDDSFYLWPDKKIPYVIGEGFNETNQANIIGNVQLLIEFMTLGKQGPQRRHLAVIFGHMKPKVDISL